ncbi:MAG: hypothetical protein HY984_02180 [Candidatus Magasanikbacteria bacterium]|nr:hypothetical protein [Candidatus Magasanikbacteria bacterium]
MAGLASPLQKLKSPRIPKLIANVVNTALGIIGSIAFALFIYGGILWMTSGGGDRQAKAMKVITWTSLGIIAILASYVLTDFVLQAFIP